jgi:opacity protein-like surface antigen
VPSQFETSTVFDVTALQASAVGIVPFAKNWEAYFGGGLAYSRVSGQQRVTERLGTAQVRSVSGSSVDYQYTFGLGVTVVPDWHVSLGYEFFAIDEKLLGVRDGADTTVDSFTLGFAHRFAGRPR